MNFVFIVIINRICFSNHRWRTLYRPLEVFLLLADSSPYFEKDGQVVTSYTVVIDDAADLFIPVINVSVKDNDDNSTLRVSMETESIYFKFNDTSCKFEILYLGKFKGQYSNSNERLQKVAIWGGGWGDLRDNFAC